jgi:hypothetical protein
MMFYSGIRGLYSSSICVIPDGILREWHIFYSEKTGRALEPGKSCTSLYRVTHLSEELWDVLQHEIFLSLEIGGSLRRISLFSFRIRACLMSSNPYFCGKIRLLTLGNLFICRNTGCPASDNHFVSRNKGCPTSGNPSVCRNIAFLTSGNPSVCRNTGFLTSGKP